MFTIIFDEVLAKGRIKEQINQCADLKELQILLFNLNQLKCIYKKEIKVSFFLHLY